MKELVTIQVGGFANFIGSHFWNFQDELMGLNADAQADQVFKSQYLNMNVLYRTGETQQGEPTYTPRLVAVDFQGSLGCMSTSGTLYKNDSCAPSNVLTWDGNVSVHASESFKKNLFVQSLNEDEHVDITKSNGNSSGDGETSFGKEIQDKDIVECLENGVKYWTDFSKVHYHPQSLYNLSGLWMEAQDFSNYGIGKDSFSWSLQGEDINERLRYFVEECDHIQGFQFIVDDSGGFSAVSADFLENVADEYANTTVLLYTVREPNAYLKSRSQKQTFQRELHDAVSFSKLSSFCDLIVPVGLPSLSKSKASSLLCIDDAKPYHCSAVYAAALHSLSLPFRMEAAVPTDSTFFSGAIDLNGVVQMLAGQARQNMVATLDVSMPAPSLTGASSESSFLGSLQTLTPETDGDVEDLHGLELITVHGMLGSGCNRASVSDVRREIEVAYAHSTTRPLFCHLSVAQCPLPIPLPFPTIFRNIVGSNGKLLDRPTSGSPARGSLDVHSIPMAARLQSSKAILPFLEKRLGNLRRYAIERGTPAAETLRSWGFGKEELEDMGEMLSKMVTALNPNSQLSSDSD